VMLSANHARFGGRHPCHFLVGRAKHFSLVTFSTHQFCSS
jgi:hypothetical protein